jgi:hypothetical protein
MGQSRSPQVAGLHKTLPHRATLSPVNSWCRTLTNMDKTAARDPVYTSSAQGETDARRSAGKRIQTWPKLLRRVQAMTRRSGRSGRGGDLSRMCCRTTLAVSECHRRALGHIRGQPAGCGREPLHGILDGLTLRAVFVPTCRGGDFRILQPTASF